MIMKWRATSIAILTMFMVGILWLTGCGIQMASPSVHQHLAQHTSGLALTVTPSKGPAGSQVALLLKSRSRPPLGGAIVCWAGCDANGYTTGVNFQRVGKGLYQGKMDLPGGFLAPAGGSDQNSRVLVPGVYSISLACLTTAPMCAYHPEAVTTFRLTRNPATPWTALAKGSWHMVSELGGLNSTAVGSIARDPVIPGRQATCNGALLAPGQSSASLVVSGPDPLRAPLSSQVFGNAHGYVGCRALALDPNNVDTVYAAGLIDAGGQGPMTFPPPVYSTNSGRTWQRVPVPGGFSSPDGFGADFVGFESSRAGVIAWFSPAANPISANPGGQVVGEETVDGGKSWQTVPLACPATGNCAWQIGTSMVYSRDKGSSWKVASFLSTILQGYAYQGPDGSLLLVERQALPYIQYPVLRSTDGGATWEFVSLATPPGGWDPLVYQGQVFLAQDGSLMANTVNGQGGQIWYRLPPGGPKWESIGGKPTNLFSGQGVQQ